jgi:hypothetical protein
VPYFRLADEPRSGSEMRKGVGKADMSRSAPSEVIARTLRLGVEATEPRLATEVTADSLGMIPPWHGNG